MRPMVLMLAVACVVGLSGCRVDESLPGVPMRTGDATITNLNYTAPTTDVTYVFIDGIMMPIYGGTPAKCEAGVALDGYNAVWVTVNCHCYNGMHIGDRINVTYQIDNEGRAHIQQVCF